MKTNRIAIALTLSAVAAFFAPGAQASPVPEQVRGQPFRSIEAMTVDGPEGLYLEIWGGVWLDGQGRESEAWKEGWKENYSRTITVPVSARFSKLKGFSRSFQIAGRGSLKPYVGEFVGYRGKKLRDFFAPFRGTAWNAGVGLIGSGFSRSANGPGIKQRTSNFAGLAPAPDGADLLGFNGGLTALEYAYKLEPAPKATIWYRLYKEGRRKSQAWKEEAAIEGLLDLELQ